MGDVGVGKGADDLGNRVYFTDVLQKLVAQSLANGCAADQTRDIYKFNCRWDNVGRVV